MRKKSNLILYLIIVFCVFNIVKKQIAYHRDDLANKDIQRSVVNKENIEEELFKINHDYKLWINIANTKVNYPVVQTNNNEYYLDHNFKKDKNIEGNLFIYNNYNSNTSKNLIIFGHNMRNNSMFATLSLFKNKEFFEKNSTINIIKGGYIYKYNVIGVSTVKADNFVLKEKFENKNDLNNYINNLKSNSDNWRNSNITMSTDLLTLYTCSYDFNDARLILISKLLGKVELSQSDMKNIINKIN